MFLAHELRRLAEKLEQPFIVPTPDAYILEGKTLSVARKADLLNQCEIMWEVMHRLQIPAKMAYSQMYTLNASTFSVLEHQSLLKNDPDTTKMIREKLLYHRFQEKPMMSKKDALELAICLLHAHQNEKGMSDDTNYNLMIETLHEMQEKT